MLFATPDCTKVSQANWRRPPLESFDAQLDAIDTIAGYLRETNPRLVIIRETPQTGRGTQRPAMLDAERKCGHGHVDFEHCATGGEVWPKTTRFIGGPRWFSPACPTFFADTNARSCA